MSEAKTLADLKRMADENHPDFSREFDRLIGPLPAYDPMQIWLCNWRPEGKPS